MPLLSLDTETNGIDFNHGARPYFVTTCDENNEQQYWEWDVDPLTRMPFIPEQDLQDIGNLIFGGVDDDGPTLVLQNAKFDVKALATVLPSFEWPWHKTHDTLVAGHLLASNRPHNLTDMAIQYLGIDIEQFEKAMEQACNEARRYCRSHYPDWQIAKAGHPHMPSAKEKCWKYDMWLPKRLAQELNEPDDHPWYRILAEYANTDTAVTIALWKVMEQELRRRDLYEIYDNRRKVLSIAYDMEKVGVTVSGERMTELINNFSQESAKCESLCVGIAESYGIQLTMPKSGNNKALQDFAFGRLGLPAVKRSEKTGVPSLDRYVLEELELRLAVPVNKNAKIVPSNKQLTFVRSLSAKRGRDTALTYMQSYQRFWLPYFDTQNKKIAACFDPRNSTFDNWFRLFPNLNPVGTDTLRWSCTNPNAQNISKKESFNLRYCFGPAPGREWWSMDAKNIELRVPAYESGEPDLIAVFDRPNDPPYYGSYHLLVFDLLHPELFKLHGKACKDLFESTWYQWVKNGNFAIIYGAQEAHADATYRVQGAYRKIRHRFPKIAQLADKQIALANKYGYVETIPDKTINPNRGYPILCARSDYGKVLPTVPLNYHVSGTAMDWTAKAMINCHEQLKEWNSKLPKPNYHMIMQVHDELVFDFPKRAHPIKDPKNSNLGRIRVLQKLMEKVGDNYVVRIPTPVGVEYHEETWDKGVICI